MKPTGKNKSKFKKWLIDNPVWATEAAPLTYEKFKNLSLGLQIGVYLAYYDSLKGNKYVAYYNPDIGKWTVWIIAKDENRRMLRNKEGILRMFTTRGKAEIALLKKANDTVNKQL